MAECKMPTIRIIAGKTLYYDIPPEFPVTTGLYRNARIVCHRTNHHIVATPGPLVALKVRPLVPDIVRERFNVMV